MSTTATTTTPTNKGLELRRSAVLKIEQARTLLDSARHDMCNLEGPGYCKRYEKVGEIERNLGDIASDLRTMKPPTGVFQI